MCALQAEPQIFRFNESRDEIVRSVAERISQGCTDTTFILNDAAYSEIKRLEKSTKPRDLERLSEWRALARGLSRMSEGERTSRIHALAREYAWDVAGNFNPSVYRVSSKLLPPLVTALLTPRKLADLAREPHRLIDLNELEDKVIVEGPVDLVKSVVANATAVFVPTHLSNMDSIVFGYALNRAGLPPATYGAGKNLFANPFLSFFMHNLGAYRVDRRLKHQIYKDVLKTYSSVLLERGYHSLFFPGGTRSRSGGIERHLKLGLLGSAIEAQARLLASGTPHKPIVVVPATINYLITLEAETLISDYLSDAGKSRYIIEDDESSRLGRMTTFMRRLLDMQGSVIIRFGTPLNLLGHPLDENAIGKDQRGRPVALAPYFRDAAGNIGSNPAREAQYTRELGEAVCQSFTANSVMMATHVVAAAAFAILRETVGARDLFQILRHRDVVVARDVLASRVRSIRDEAVKQEAAGKLVLTSDVRTASGGDLVESAVRAFAGYHTTPVLEPRPDGLGLADPNLLFFYQNRLAAHGLAWDVIAPRRAS